MPSVTSNSFTLAIIKPHALKDEAEILAEIQSAGIQVISKQYKKLQESDIEEFYKEHLGKPFFPQLSQMMTSGECLAMVLSCDNAVKQWRKLCGPTNPDKAKTDAPTSLRARFGVDGTRNAVHGSDSDESAEREIRFFFPDFHRIRGEEYLQKEVYPTLKKGLSELVKEKPADPQKWLGEWLLQNNTNQPRVIE